MTAGEPLEGGQNRCRSGRRPKPSAQLGAFRGRSRRQTHRAIQLPPLSCPRSGPPQPWRFTTPNAGPRCSIHPSVGGYQPPVTPGGGYRLRLSPKCLADNDSHRPTIHRLLQSPREVPWVFGPPLSGRGSPVKEAMRRSSGAITIRTGANADQGGPRCDGKLGPRLTILRRWDIDDPVHGSIFLLLQGHPRHSKPLQKGSSAPRELLNTCSYAPPKYASARAFAFELLTTLLPRLTRVSCQPGGDAMPCPVAASAHQTPFPAHIPRTPQESRPGRAAQRRHECRTDSSPRHYTIAPDRDPYEAPGKSEQPLRRQPRDGTLPAQMPDRLQPATTHPLGKRPGPSEVTPPTGPFSYCYRDDKVHLGGRF